jgi:hypothetical protein
MLIFIAAPVLLSSAAGLIAVLSFSTGFTNQTREVLYDLQAPAAQAVIGEYTAFLAAAAQIDFIKDTAAKNPQARVQSNIFISAYAENVFGVCDIIITDESASVFTSHTGDYAPAAAFRDDADTVRRVALSPSRVSELYDRGMFYCAKPIRDSENENTIIGYIILKSDSKLFAEYTQLAGTIPAFGVWLSAFAIAAGVCLVNAVIMFVSCKVLMMKLRRAFRVMLEGFEADESHFNTIDHFGN